MLKCLSCNFISNNYRFCEGCGRKLDFSFDKKSTELNEDSSRFLEESILAVESIFYTENVQSHQLEIGHTSLDLTSIAKDTGIYIIEGMQWQNINPEIKNRCFFSDILLTLTLSLLFVSGTFAVVPFSAVTFFKLWVSGFIFVSFILWVIFPFLTGATVFSILTLKAGLFKDNTDLLKGNLGSLFFLFLFVQLYIFLPFLLLEVIMSVKNKGYVPLAMKIAGVDFLMRVGGDY